MNDGKYYCSTVFRFKWETAFASCCFRGDDGRRENVLSGYIVSSYEMDEKKKNFCLKVINPKYPLSKERPSQHPYPVNDRFDS